MRTAESELLLLETAITELVDNAFRHTDKGRVSVKVHATRSAAQVIVHDEGDGFDLRGTLTRLARKLDDDPSVLGQRGLTLLEAQGVGLENGLGDDMRHWVKSTISWDSPSLGAPDNRKIIKVRDNGCLTVSLSGRLDRNIALFVQAALIAAAHDPKTNGIVLDLASIDYASSIGLRFLQEIRQVARFHRYEVVLANVQPLVAEILAVARFDQIFRISKVARRPRPQLMQTHANEAGSGTISH